MLHIFGILLTLLGTVSVEVKTLEILASEILATSSPVLSTAMGIAPSSAVTTKTLVSFSSNSSSRTLDNVVARVVESFNLADTW